MGKALPLETPLDSNLATAVICSLPNTESLLKESNQITS